ncbi:copper chaperone [Tribonema minus]|uniref:Copper chaperone n=1 Tax=Tribonema minus TaxID=303371 RepID=A0A835YZJ0_9STRA|nr:copper chaperone [Tribonema minus]
MSDETVVFKVGMTCEGCANACKRILGKMSGVSAVNTDVAAKTVTVSSDGTTSPQAMLDALKVWSAASGKPVELAA